MHISVVFPHYQSKLTVIIAHKRCKNKNIHTHSSGICRVTYRPVPKNSVGFVNAALTANPTQLLKFDHA